ncbi:MAG: Ig-like domain-containing protein, partial [Armatimonadota bacterium]|nr:Ig-like domain-containing protein [Armatimonadota bacterium]
IEGWSNGQHTITIVATDTAGQTGSDSIVVTLDAAGDTDPPVVTINTPTESQEIGDEVTVNATVIDNVQVASVKFWIDGQLQETLMEENAGADGYEWTWQTSGWANGSHTIRVSATDTASNIAYDEVGVTLNRSKATMTKYLISKQVPITSVEDMWRRDVTFRRTLLTVLLREELPTDPREVYQVTCGVHVPGNVTDFSQFQIITPHQVHGLPAEGDTVRWALRAEPTLVDAYWDVTATAAVRLIDAPDVGPLLLTTGPQALWALEDGDWVQWRTLPELSAAYDGAHLDGKILVAGNKFVVVDCDTGELSWPVGLPDATGYSAVAADNDAGYVGVDTAAGAKLYQWSYPITKLLAALPAPGNVMAAESGVVAIGCADGSLQRWEAGSLTEVVDTGTAGVYSMQEMGTGTMYLGTGASAAIWVSVPSWAQDADLGTGDVRALAHWLGHLYAAGVNAGDLWKRTPSGWTLWHTLTDYTQVRDLLVADDQLWVAGETAGGVRLTRLELAADGAFECSSEPPDILANIPASVSV